MPLRGELDSVDLAHVLQMLVLNERAGVLEICHDGAKRSVYFEGDSIRIRFERDLISERVIRTLSREGVLRQADVDRARANVAVNRRDMVDTLVEIGVLTKEQQHRAIRHQLEEETYELFFLKGATFEFREGESPTGVAEAHLALNVNAIIMEAARRVDEWSYIQQLVHSGADIFEVTGDISVFDPSEITSELRDVHAMLDGVATLDEIVEKTGMCRFLVFRNVALLAERSAAAVVSSASLVERGEALMTAGRLDSAVACFQQAIQQGVQDVAVLTNLAQCLESLGRAARAAQSYFDAGRLAEESNDIDSAVRLYLHVRGLLPTRIDARQRLFELRKLVTAHVGANGYDAEAEGGELAQVLHELGRREDVRRVLAGLVEHAGENARALERAAEVAGNVGQPAFAIEALLLARDRHRSAGDIRSALHVNRRAQALDPSRDDLAQTARILQGTLFDRQDRRRATIRASTLLVGFGIFFFGYGKYSASALDAYGEYSIEDCLASKDFVAGRDHFSSIRNRFPLTIPFLLSGEKLREIAVHEKHSKEVAEYRSQVEGERTSTNLKQAKALHEGALAARHGGDYRKSLMLLRRAAELSGTDDPLELGDAIESLEEYLAGAARLRTEAGFYRTAGRVDEAHARLVELLEKFPSAPECESLTLPVTIDSEPRGAEIRLDGRPLRIGDDKSSVMAETPFVVDFPHGHAVDIELVRDGFAPYALRIDPRADHRLFVDLPRRPELEAMLSHDVAQPFVFSDERVFAALSSGRIAALDSRSLEVRWTRELPNLAEACAPMRVDGDRLLVPTTQRRLAALSIQDGSIVYEIELPEKPESQPVRSGDEIAVRCAGGRLAVGPANAKLLETVNLPSPATLGPVVLTGGRLAVACEDGRVWVRSRDGSLAALRGFELPMGRVTALAADDATLWLGDENGAFFVFDGATQQHRCSLRVFDGSPIESISIDATQPAIGSLGKIAVVDCNENRVRATSDDGLTLIDAPGPLLAAVGDDGTIRILERSDMHLLASFACGEKLLPFGGVDRSRAYFAGLGGRVLGVAIGKSIGKCSKRGGAGRASTEILNRPGFGQKTGGATDR